MPTRLTRTIVPLLLACGLAACGSVEDVSTRNIVVGPTGEGLAATPVAYTTRGGGGAMRAYVTGYSFWDNTPPGSAQIARPVVHRQAGGTGTYADPVTVAVGHSKQGGRSRMDFPAGTRFYFPHLQKYGIVEDLCGDGPRPQDGPCHSGHAGHAWLDIYVGGRSVGASASNRCMNSITGINEVVMHPEPGLPVHRGEIALSNCAGRV